MHLWILSIYFFFKGKKPRLGCWGKAWNWNFGRIWTGHRKTHLKVLGHCQESKNWLVGGQEAQGQSPAASPAALAVSQSCGTWRMILTPAPPGEQECCQGALGVPGGQDNAQQLFPKDFHTGLSHHPPPRSWSCGLPNHIHQCLPQEQISISQLSSTGEAPSPGMSPEGQNPSFSSATASLFTTIF